MTPRPQKQALAADAAAAAAAAAAADAAATPTNIAFLRTLVHTSRLTLKSNSDDPPSRFAKKESTHIDRTQLWGSKDIPGKCATY